jgi:hypothetical protein
MHQIAGYLGHRVSRTTELYAHHYPDHMKEALAARAAMILCTDGIPTLPPVNYWNIPAITVSRRQRLQSFAVGPHPGKGEVVGSIPTGNTTKKLWNT